MSSTAQKQDITDPEVIDAFAKKVGNERALSALYLLTVADIRGTSPSVWNAWKASSSKTSITRRGACWPAAQHSARSPTASSCASARRAACCASTRCPMAPRSGSGASSTSPYFQRHTADEIAWHARHLHWRVDHTAPVVKVRLAKDGAGLQALVYLPDQKYLFARICGFFGRAGLSILDAKVHTTRNGYALDTFAVHDPANPTASYRETIQYIEYELAQALASPAPLTPPEAGRISRQLRHFPLTPEVQIFPDDKGTHFILEIVAGDRPGLLARIAYALAQANINVVSARINTLGERAEDVFLISGAKLHDEQALLRLETALYEQLRV